MAEPVAASDEGINQSFGYKQELRRALRLFSLYAVAFSIISITTVCSRTTDSALRTSARP